MAEYEKVDVHRPPPQELSDESDDDFDTLRTSADVRRHDQEILQGEEEVEKLLSGSIETSNVGISDRQRRRQEKEARRENGRERRQYEKEAKRERKRDARREKRRLKSGRGQKEEESELLYEMEEGHKDSSDSSGNSSEVDRMKPMISRVLKTPHRSHPAKTVGIPIVILLTLVLFVYGAYRASSHKPHAQHLLKTLSNGTSAFAPTTILISLDGFRADFLHRNITPSMNAFIQAGVSPKYMLPSFPSVTFPNHFTLVTGLYPEAHGVVGNTFWDPALQEEFYNTDPARSMQPKWWQGEPLWETAEYQGVRSAIHMWPGSEAHIGKLEPTYVDNYNGKELLSNKVNRVLGLLDLPGPDDKGSKADTPRPQFIAAYVPNVDQHGHLYGPNSTEINTDISSVDTMLGDLFRGLEERNLTDIVNIVIVSDHGMASTDTSRIIQLDDIIDMSLIEHVDGWPLFGLRPKKDESLMPLYNHLKAEAAQSGNFEVYLRDKDMPERYHFSQNKRIAPLWIIPNTGWAIVTRDEFDVKQSLEEGLVYHPRGLHGYDHEHPLMRAIFLARGPAFPHTPGSEIEVFQNIEVYNIVCDSLGIEPRPNNGTLRLPLKPVGLHNADIPGETPDDPPLPNKQPTVPDLPVPSDDPVIPEQPATPEQSPKPGASDATEEPTIDRPVVHDGGDPEDENFNHWWDWVKGKLDGVKTWATGLVNKPGPSGEGDEQAGAHAEVEDG